MKKFVKTTASRLMIRNLSILVVLFLAITLSPPQDSVSATNKNSMSTSEEANLRIARHSGKEVLTIKFTKEPNLAIGAPLISGSSLLGTVKQIAKTDKSSAYLAHIEVDSTVAENFASQRAVAVVSETPSKGERAAQNFLALFPVPNSQKENSLSETKITAFVSFQEFWKESKQPQWFN